MRRAILVWALISLVLGCGDSVTPEPSAGGDPSDGLEPIDVPHVSWEVLESMILSGKAIMVAETHSNWAIVTMKDGSSVASREPERGAVFQVVSRCGRPCAGIGIAIE